MRGHQNTKISQYIIIIIITPNFVKRYSLVGEINWWFDVMNKIIRLIIVRKTEQTEFEKEYNCSPKSTTNSETTNSDLWWSNLQKNKIPEKRNNFNKKKRKKQYQIYKTCSNWSKIQIRNFENWLVDPVSKLEAYIRLDGFYELKSNFSSLLNFIISSRRDISWRV